MYFIEACQLTALLDKTDLSLWTVVPKWCFKEVLISLPYLQLELGFTTFLTTEHGTRVKLDHFYLNKYILDGNYIYQSQSGVLKEVQ